MAMVIAKHVGAQALFPFAQEMFTGLLRIAPGRDEKHVLAQRPPGARRNAVDAGRPHADIKRVRGRRIARPRSLPAPIVRIELVPVEERADLACLTLPAGDELEVSPELVGSESTHTLLPQHPPPLRGDAGRRSGL